MGSPDPYGRQLNGMGGGISSTSKVCVLSRSSRPDADIDFTFLQVGIKDGRLDLAGNCGNMLSAVGVVGWQELGEGEILDGVPAEGGKEKKVAMVRIHNSNTGKLIHARFEVDRVTESYDPKGDYETTGVPGRGSRITLEFLYPGGAKTGKGAFPTGKVVDELVLADGTRLEASLVDVSNPGVFVRLEDLGLGNATMPGDVEGDEVLKGRLEEVRQKRAEMIGLDPRVQSVPKIVLVGSPAESEEGIDIRCLALSMCQAHKAVPLTLALCLGAAAGVQGTIPYQLKRSRQDAHKKKATETEKTTVTIGHPSGNVGIGIRVKHGEVVSAELHRTAKILMKGEVSY
jgi:2-methylaconitate cis-trans-isomerase PrpF